MLVLKSFKSMPNQLAHTDYLELIKYNNANYMVRYMFSTMDKFAVLHFVKYDEAVEFFNNVLDYMR